ncbi:SDR family oxidoreductase [Cumulibacter soli]|uniref:SDR family oxidoreductase n=1 Tax=Cumulibacter soli TaxID=2546344 RepID=UPI001067F1BA|nr:SDR family oxidoreductase [Cumulibacter soli]
MRIVVTGGHGALGREIMADAKARGHQVSNASRVNGVDLRTGAGLAEAVAGADAVVHCASNPRDPRPVDIDGTRRLIEATGPDTHIVYVSIVGVDQTPYSYYHAKLAAEKALAESPGPSTVVRATQFHGFAASMARRLTRGPISFTVGNMASQPVDVTWVARRMLDYATGDLPSGPVRATDLAGPEVLTMPQIVAMLRRHDGGSVPKTLRLPAFGATMKAFASGSILAGKDAETGGATFHEWLAADR